MSESELCPKCSYPRQPGGVECPACGIVYERYRGAPPPLPGESTSLGLPPPPQAADLDPYAPPASDLLPGAWAGAPPVAADGDVGVWHWRNLLVMDKRARLPMRCLRCDQPASTTLKRHLSWHQPIIYLTLLANLLVYLLVAMLVRKRARVELPLCDDHLSQRRVWLTLGSIAFVIGLLFAFWSLSGEPAATGCWLSVALVVGGLVTVALMATPVSPRKIDDRYVWLKKVSPEYLERLPEAPDWLPPL